MKLPVGGWILVGSMIFTPMFSASAADLAPPFRVAVNGEPIDTDVGHAAPWFDDFDGDGLSDLLVGQFGGGKLRIYRNEGTATEPKFLRSAWFQSAGALGTVPAS